MYQIRKDIWTDGRRVEDMRTDVIYTCRTDDDAEKLALLLSRCEQVEILGGPHEHGFVYSAEPGTVSE
jgi:hypothetical protein